MDLNPYESPNAVAEPEPEPPSNPDADLLVLAAIVGLPFVLFLVAIVLGLFWARPH